MSRRDQIGADAAASIDGAPASLEEAAAAAAQLLARSSQPLIAGLGADIEGARAAIALAERLGGVVEHMHSAALMRDLDCLRETGVMLTTPGEARVRADVVLLVGDALLQTWPGLNERLLRLPARPDGVDVTRRILWLAPQADATIPGFDGDIEVIAAGLGATLAANLAALRARVKGRPVARAQIPLPTLDALAAVLKGARFGVAVWTAAHLGALELEMLNGLVRDLNETTRFSTLPLARARQWRGRARCLRLDDRLPHANRIRRRRASRMIPGASTPSDSSRQGKPIARCGSPHSERRRRPGGAR